MSLMHTKILKPTVTSLMIIGLLVGCSSVSAPKQSLNDRLDYTEQIADQYQKDDQWWAIYQDAQLNKLVQTALDNNIDYAQAAINVNRALYQAKLLGSDLVPSF